MGRLLWVLGGGLCGVALSENKKLVGEVLVSIAYMGKGAASSALEIQVQVSTRSKLPQQALCETAGERLVLECSALKFTFH